MKGLFRSTLTFLFLLSLVILFSFPVYKSYGTSHFRIYSNMPKKYIHFIKNNLEACYSGVVEKYFPKGFDRPLVIYYSKTQTDSNKLLRNAGLGQNIGYGVYIDRIPSVYTHRYMDDKSQSGWGSLFHEVVHHLINENYDNYPSWFNEGLAAFIGEKSRAVKGRFMVGHANPWRERMLRDRIKKGMLIKIEELLSLSDNEFYELDIGMAYARAFFYWLHKTGNLYDYLHNVKENGYDINVLEISVSKARDEINSELLLFIKQHCYPAAYVKDAWLSDGLDKKKEFLSKALSIKSNYEEAVLELARIDFKNRNWQECRNRLSSILKHHDSTSYKDAVLMGGHSYYHEKDYLKALEYFNKAWEYADYDEQKYEIAYWIGSCYYYLKNDISAKEWYSNFLRWNWEPNAHSDWMIWVKKYMNSKIVTQI